MPAVKQSGNLYRLLHGLAGSELYLGKQNQVKIMDVDQSKDEG